MPRAGGNLRTRSAVPRRPPLFADSGWPEVRKHVQSGVRPPWYPRRASVPAAHARPPRGLRHRPALRRLRHAHLRLPPEQAGGGPRQARRRRVPGPLRLRARRARRHGRPAEEEVRRVPLEPARGRGLPGLPRGGRRRVHREQREVLQVHRLLEGLRRRRRGGEEVRLLQEVPRHLLPPVLRGPLPGGPRREGPIGTSCPASAASASRTPPSWTPLSC